MTTQKSPEYVCKKHRNIRKINNHFKHNISSASQAEDVTVHSVGPVKMSCTYSRPVVFVRVFKEG